MAKAKATNASSSSANKKRKPATTPEARENQLIAGAMDLAEQQIRDGTASSQVITFFLKLGAEKEKNKLELEKLKEENSLLRAKTSKIESDERSEERYKNAIEAMRKYQGLGAIEDDQDIL